MLSKGWWQVLTLHESVLFAFSGFLERELGLDYPPERYKDLVETIASQKGFTKSEELEAYFEKVMKASLVSRHLLDEVAELLSINETYFFRRSCGFEKLERELFPSLINAKRNSSNMIRVWSAGCCTGEEPYSIAILLSELIENIHEWNIHIMGSDINKKNLKKASDGIYRNWSFRNVSDERKKRYFSKLSDGTYKLNEDILSMVSFRQINMVDDVFPSMLNNTGGLDLIMCNNVLMYLTRPQIERVITKFAKCLLEPGYLIVTPSEAGFVRDGLLHVMDECHIFSKRFPRTETAEIPEVVTKAAPRFIKPKQRSVQELFQEGEYKTCIEILAQKEGRSEEESTLLIASYGNVGEVDAAEKECRVCIGKDTLVPQFHYLLGSILLEKDQQEEAITELKRALFLDADHVMAHFALGSLLAAKGCEKEAEVHKRVVLERVETMMDNDIIPGSERLTAGQLKEMAKHMGAA